MKAEPISKSAVDWFCIKNEIPLSSMTSARKTLARKMTNTKAEYKSFKRKNVGLTTISEEVVRGFSMALESNFISAFQV
jgi:hypothetical protein